MCILSEETKKPLPFSAHLSEGPPLEFPSWSTRDRNWPLQVSDTPPVTQVGEIQIGLIQLEEYHNSQCIEACTVMSNMYVYITFLRGTKSIKIKGTSHPTDSTCTSLRQTSHRL